MLWQRLEESACNLNIKSITKVKITSHVVCPQTFYFFLRRSYFTSFSEKSPQTFYLFAYPPPTPLRSQSRPAACIFVRALDDHFWRNRTSVDRLHRMRLSTGVLWVPAVFSRWSFMTWRPKADQRATKPRERQTWVNEETIDRDPPRQGDIVRTPIYELYRYEPPWRVWFSGSLVSDTI